MSQTPILSHLLHRAWPGWQRTETEPVRMTKRSSKLPLYQCPKRLLALLALAIFFGETCVMLLLTFFQPLPVGVEALLDSAMLLIIISPTFYFLLFRPFMQHLRRQEQSQTKILNLSQQLMVVSEAERKKVAMDLHDHFGQVLTGLQFGLESLHDSLREKQAAENSRTAELLVMAKRLGEDIRGYAACLRPTLIDDMGLVATLEWHVDELRRQHPELYIEFRSYGLKRQPSPAIAEALFRIYQEALNNVVKHARAQQVEILLVFCHPNFILTVRDDGVGFDTGYSAGQSGIGLWSMRERVEMAGGGMHIISRREAGTTVRVELPAGEGEADE